MNNSLSCSDGRWCTRADALLGVEGIHVNSVTTSGTGLVLGVETGEDVTGCPDCGVVAVGHGRRQVRLHDIPCFGGPVRLLWAKRLWRCPDPGCPRTTFTEEHPLAGPRAKLTARAVSWAGRPTRSSGSTLRCRPRPTSSGCPGTLPGTGYGLKPHGGSLIQAD
ncbi:transposase family protein [Arthrobacter sp. UYCu712]|uniref:transposase family protein n=1 Tax=Arthrobacter sp. UYCu712 TaxID=3156340 RepID=UPI003395D7B8